MRNLTDCELANIVGKCVYMVAEKKGTQEESTNGPKRAHAVHETYIDRRRVSLHMVIYVSCAQGEEG